ncbi:unnamed protein product (plasmid) [Mycetohabitans rhizoxinica HKI 454]|uniref:Uncharacterized protein n=1 Tax=Mycetohabitans rhizoxinica (strain DSM 19002 / CIP 109453 / HKI 454) TaxID=882378 RepID=E5AVJ9_MYCRK|nr:unnamed protein product [Mycetohabitans rhizoxinica HKI 454]
MLDGHEPHFIRLATLATPHLMILTLRWLSLVRHLA